MSLPAPKVLIVEDEPLIAMMVEEALEEAGYRSGGTAGSEEEALRLAAEDLPDFAVLDINLELGGSGLNVGRALAARGVSILYATGYCPQHRDEMEGTGARACLSKPYRPGDVPAALEALAGMRDGRQPDHLPETLHLFEPGEASKE
jgi:DNA-binding response OmpR family regulator